MTFITSSEDAQIDIAKSIKAISERGVRVCIASVPHKSDDMVRANDELTGRIVSILFDCSRIEGHRDKRF